MRNNLQRRLLAAAAFLPRLIGKLRERPKLEVKELKRRLDAGEDLVFLDVRNAAPWTGSRCARWRQIELVF